MPFGPPREGGASQTIPHPIRLRRHEVAGGQEGIDHAGLEVGIVRAQHDAHRDAAVRQRQR